MRARGRLDARRLRGLNPGVQVKARPTQNTKSPNVIRSGSCLVSVVSVPQVQGRNESK